MSGNGKFISATDSLRAVIPVFMLLVYLLVCMPGSTHGQVYRGVKIENYHQRLTADQMREMAESIDELVLINTMIDLNRIEEHQTKALDELKTLERIAGSVNDNADIYDDTGLEPFMESLLRDIAIARELVIQIPPNFQPAAELIYSCSSCHTQR